MKRAKKLYILLGVLIIACIATYAVSRVQEHKEKIKNSDAIVLEIPTDTVTALSFEHDDESLAFHKDDKWLYDDDEAFPVDEEKMKNLLSQFESFGVAFEIDDVDDISLYGLDTPVCTIKITVNGTQVTDGQSEEQTETQSESPSDEKTYEILLGDYSKMDSQRYVSIGDGKVYLVKNDPFDKFNIELSDMIDQDETPTFNSVSSITFTGSEDYEITRDESGDYSYCADDVYYTDKDGEKLPLDTINVAAYLRKITKLDLKDYVTYNITDEELVSYGLDDPELTINVDYELADEDVEDSGSKEQNFVMTVCRDPKQKEADTENEDDITAYVRIGESQIVYKITGSEYNSLMSASYDDLRHKEVLSADFAIVKQVDITLDGNNYTIIAKTEDKETKYYYNDKEIDIANFQSAMEALEADSFTDETPSDKEEISMTVYLDNENFPEVTIQFYRYDGTDCIAVVDGKPVSLVGRAQVVDLIEAVNAIVL